MVQIVENWAVIRGPIVARAPHPRLQDYDLVTVRIDDAQPVAGVENLLSQFIGAEMPVAVRRDLLKDAAPGVILSCRAKRTIDGAMCEAHPKYGDFSVTPGSSR